MKRRSSVALGFIALILIGALVLVSPWARADGAWGAFGDALFTACSAVCVTGLSVVDVGTEYSHNGIIVLTALVEIGCIGLITCGTFLLVAIGRRLSLQREFLLMNAYGAPAVKGLRGLIVWVVGSMLAFQAIGAVVLRAHGFSAARAVFYSAMSFCNAGFSVDPGSLATWIDDPFAVVTMGLLTILGGSGFLVLFNLFTFRFAPLRATSRGRLTLHTRTVLRVSAILFCITLVAFLCAEWGHSLAGMPLAKRLWVGFYQSVTPRTCGFCLVPTADLQPVTRLVYEVMMFLGGAPGSAAGGIKVTTLAVLMCTLTAMCRGETETVISQRTVSSEIVRESIVIVMTLAAMITLVMGVLLVTERGGGIGQDALFFEAVSAVTTTGLTVGDTTRSLSMAGRIVLMTAMFCGRLGALAVVMMIGDRESKRRIRYPQEELVVG
ncbi:MAG: hypothetical protein IKF72_04000 [Kiritimatiellae bacterium]|nr:hypothetical protein [Kiritimatiellia bacterium]